jgi:hypothetical protein
MRTVERRYHHRGMMIHNTLYWDGAVDLLIAGVPRLWTVEQHGKQIAFGGLDML